MNSFRQLEYISAVAKHRSITKAAESLYISQSAMSHYILKIEEELGLPLFNRSTTPISLTYAGECFVDSANRILLEREQLNKRFRDISDYTVGKLKIGTSRERGAYMMPILIPAFAKLYPGIDIEVFTASGYKLREALREGLVDFLILPNYSYEESIGIERENIYREELLYVAHNDVVKKHHLVKSMEKHVNLKKLEDIPYFLLFQEHAIRNASNHIFKQNNVKPQIKMEFSSNITCLRMASTGMGSAIIPHLTTNLTKVSSDLSLFSIGREGVFWDVQVLYLKDSYLGQPERDFFNLIGQLFDKEGLHSR